MQRFPELPQFTGYNAPFRTDCSIADLEIEGDLPSDLNGTWYRCGPDPMYPPKSGDDIYINGDGAISYFRFEKGRVSFNMRHVRTEKYLAERKAGKALYGNYRNPFTDDDEVQGKDRSTANTTAWWHAGKLFALKEDGLPYEIDPNTLETLGRWNFLGKLKSQTVTAHPKKDIVTGEWVFFGYEVDGLASNRMAYCVADREGNLTKEEWFDAPYAAMQHDFAVTRDYVIFMVFPTIASMESMKAGGPHFVWDQKLDTHIGIMPRNGTAKDIVWFSRPTCYSFHVANAYNNGSTITIDLCVSKRNAFPYFPDIDGAEYNPEEGAPFLTRWTFDFKNPKTTFQSKQLSPIPGELPRIDDRVAMRKHQVVYYGAFDPQLPLNIAGPIMYGSNLIVRVEVDSGKIQTLHLGENRTFQEPQFVPKGGSEIEGYLIAVIDRHEVRRASVAVLDAANIEKGPIAMIHLPVHLRDAFHGTWVPAGES